LETWIALLRAVNVGGRNKLPMKMLAAELEAIGLSAVKTYIQSGNVVFRCPSARTANLAAEIGAAIKAKFGFEIDVAVISAKGLAAAVRANPFPESAAEMDGRTLHFFFLAKAPGAIDQGRLEAVRRQSERWQIKGTVFYLHAPEGFGDSKLAAQVERILGVTATARNWRTVRALLDLAAVVK
jgi:uncharacterized protein (DUF1697 family)